MGWLMGLEPEMGGIRGFSGALLDHPPQGDAPRLPAAAPAAPLELPLTCLRSLNPDLKFPRAKCYLGSNCSINS